MKLGCMVSTPDITRQGTLALLKGTFEQKLEKAKRLGYDGVELMVCDPASLDVNQVKELLQEFGLEVPQVVTGELYGMLGLALVHPDSVVCEAAMQRTHQVIQFAGALGSGTLVNIGRLRGRMDWLTITDPLEKRTQFIKTFQAVSDYAAKFGVRISLEPCNRYEVDFVHNTSDALQVIQEVGRQNFGLMLDVFHMNIEDASLEGALRQARPVLWHVHVADSNRWAPGQGHLDFRSIVDTLVEMDYDDYLSGEMLPLPDPDTAARQTIEYMRQWV